MLCLLPACLPACHCCATLIIHTRHSDAGCAAVFLPFWRDCGSKLAQTDAYLSVVALCEARVAGYQCSCVGGWGGANCDEPSSCDGDPCGAHGTCVAVLGRWNHCQCETGWGGVTCGDYVVGIPNHARSVLRVNTATGEVDTIGPALEGPEFGYLEGKYKYLSSDERITKDADGRVVSGILPHSHCYSRVCPAHNLPEGWDGVDPYLK